MITYPISPSCKLATPDIEDLFEENEWEVREAMPGLPDIRSINIWTHRDDRFALTFTFAPYGSLTNVDCTWIYVPLRSDTIYPVRNHSQSLNLVSPAQGICDVFVTWIVPDRYVHVSHGNYNFVQQRIKHAHGGIRQ